MYRQRESDVIHSSQRSGCLKRQLQDAQMLQQDLQTDQDQDDSARQFRLGLIARAEHIADPHADRGEDEGCDTDQADRRKNRNLQECEGDAYGERVNACGDGQGKHVLCVQRSVWIFRRAVLFLESFPQHGEPDDAQERESDPMVDRSDIVFVLTAHQEADQGHQRLKGAKPETDNTGFYQGKFFDGQTLTDGHGEGVHGEADSDQKQTEQTHT